MIKGVIFDLDGVICSTDEFHYQAWKVLADNHQIYFDREINNRLRGVSRMESLDIVLERSDKKYSSIEKEEMATYKNEIYKKLLTQMNPSFLLDGVLDTLKELKRKGIKIAIGSSSKNTKAILSYLKISEMFDAIADGTDIKYSKPNPEVFLKAAERLHLLPNECLVVEDAFAGIKAANDGGFTSVAVGDATKDKSAHHRLEDIKELLNLIK